MQREFVVLVSPHHAWHVLTETNISSTKRLFLPSMATTITLHRLVKNPSKYDGSTWVNRLDCFLTMSKTDFSYSTGTFQSSKTGKMPYITVKNESGEEECIADSLASYEELIKRGLAADLDEGISADAKAKGRAIESLAAELYWIGVNERLAVDFGA